MRDFFKMGLALAAMAFSFALMCMMYALPVMFGIWLWNLIF